MTTAVDAISEAMRALGGEASISDVTNWIERHYPRNWRAGTIATLMADLTLPGNRSSPFTPSERFLRRVGTDRYRAEDADTHASLPVDIDEPVMLIRISQLYERGMSSDELYDATRGHWKVTPDRHDARLALAVADGIVREVYEIHSWHQAGTTLSATDIHTTAPSDRMEFVGRVADAKTRNKYIGRSVAHYFSYGNQNPIRYVNC